MRVVEYADRRRLSCIYVAGKDVTRCYCQPLNWKGEIQQQRTRMREHFEREEGARPVAKLAEPLTNLINFLKQQMVARV
jgi:hypothetical protein